MRYLQYSDYYSFKPNIKLGKLPTISIFPLPLIEQILTDAPPTGGPGRPGGPI